MRTETAVAEKPRRLPAWLDPVFRWVGLVVAIGLAALTAGFEAVYSQLYLSPTMRAPYALVAAALLNPALVWFTYTVTGRRITVLGPVFAWVAVMFLAASATNEGDLFLTSRNWVGIWTMIVGTVAFAAGGYRLILTSMRPPA